MAELFEAHATEMESLDTQAGLGLSLVALLLAENKRLAREAAQTRSVLQEVIAGLEADVEVGTTTICIYLKIAGKHICQVRLSSGSSTLCGEIWVAAGIDYCCLVCRLSTRQQQN